MRIVDIICKVNYLYLDMYAKCLTLVLLHFQKQDFTEDRETTYAMNW